jgi:hypothetical protein
MARLRWNWIGILILGGGLLAATAIPASSLACPLPTVPESMVHDFHVSKTRLEYAVAQDEWQLSLHIFIDDLELGLAAKTDEKFFLGTERELSFADSLIHHYLQEKIDLIADGQTLQLEWLGKEITEDLSAFWVYMYAPKAAVPVEVTISNRVLLEVYDDQQNIVELIGPGARKDYMLFHRDYQRENIRF